MSKEKMSILQYVNIDGVDDGIKFFVDAIEKYCRAELSEGNIRTITYAMNGLLGWFKHKDDLRIEERIDALEKQMGLNR